MLGGARPHVAAGGSGDEGRPVRSEVESTVREVIATPGEPLGESARGAFGHDFARVRIHSDSRARESARAVDAVAYSAGDHVVLDDRADLTPRQKTHVLAHELAHAARGDPAGRTVVRRYGTPIPPVANPTVVTMVQYIDLVRRVEAAHPGWTALRTAQAIMRTKYHTSGWDWLLPSSAGTAGVPATGGVTASDVTTLAGEFDVQLPQGGLEDASHVVASIVAAAERLAPSTNSSGGVIAGVVVAQPPPGLTQLDIASWAGDPGSAAGEWMTAHPHPKGGTTKQAYMDEFSPESDMIGDIDGVAMASGTAAAGFAFDNTRPLSENLTRFYFPSLPREGKNRRFHIFCSALGFALEPDGVTLTAGAVAAIDARIKAFADWYTANDPNILSWMTIHGNSQNLFNPIPRLWITRANDWRWFAAKFRDFVQRNLTAEGP